MSEWNFNFCQNLHYLRQKYGITQREMAKILGVSTGTYGKMERCHPSVRIHCGMVCRVCDYFQISADEILQQNWQEIRKADK